MAVGGSVWAGAVVPVHGAYCVNIKMLWEIINEPSSFPVQVKTADTHNFLGRINIVAMN